MLLLFFIRNVAAEKGVTHQQIAEATGFKRANVSRMLAAKYKPNLDNFLALCRAVGLNLFIEDKEGDSVINAAFEKAMLEIGRRKRDGQEN